MEVSRAKVKQQGRESRHGEGNNKGDDEEGAEIDFVVTGLRDDGEHNEESQEISEKEINKGEKWICQGQAKRDTEKPIAITDPFTTGDFIEQKIDAGDEEH